MVACGALLWKHAKLVEGAMGQIRFVSVLCLLLWWAGMAGAAPAIGITVLSSAPEHVSGGDVRIEVQAPAALHDSLTFWLNGVKIAPSMVRSGDRLEGIVSGLAEGPNRLEVAARPDQARSALMLTNHLASGPLFSGPQQLPFICRTQESGLGQPLVDNQDGIGHPVFAEYGGALLGYSKYCNIKTRTDRFYFTGSQFKPFDAGAARPPDLATTMVDGVAVPFVVKVEVGTLNRFLYTIAMLEQAPWNGKLVYWLRGGVGIGHQQGKALWFNGMLNSSERQLMPRMLAQGYAIISSSGNETGVHYNMRLAEETALMTKEYFIKRHGRPRFTIGIGGSGGAVQQYFFAQNRPGLLDGGIPILSYPDMITQTIPISDCPLLGQYFKDEVARDPASRWAAWDRQGWIEGMNTSATAPNPLTGKPGSTECINGWRAAMPAVLNPVFKDPRFDVGIRVYGYSGSVFPGLKWTHWNDLANIYGRRSDGYAPVSIDNVGVQYGLAALAGGRIDVDEFLRMNACIGGWKEQAEFVDWDTKNDPFDSRNMRRDASCRDPAGRVAPRRAADISAIRSAYASGHVFTGARLGIPMIDLRPYLEPVLDMHNSRQSFSVRARLQDGGAATANQVIWFFGSKNTLADNVMDALGVLDRFLTDGAAPPEFADKCVDAGGVTIGAGPAAWDGILNKNPAGACTRAFPVFSSPRMVAGESIKGDTFKCALKPVATALADGTYPANVSFSAAQSAWLNKIFPDGVCDYRLPGSR
jgi:hypothetical protein